VSSSQSYCKQADFVSLWVGSFPSLEDAEGYFGISDEVGVCLPADPFASDFCLGEFPPETLEVNFEQMSPRSLDDLLRDATFGASFLPQAIAAAARQGIDRVQGVALLYDFDYRLRQGWRDAAGPLRFVGAFPFARYPPNGEFKALYDVAQELNCPVATVVYVLASISGARKKRQAEHGDLSRHVTGRQCCEWLLTCRGEDSEAVLSELGLRRSEEVGRVMFALARNGLVARLESDAESDFARVFELN
jgi:uncharacterized repeat protein (TIGR04138 family)